MPAAALAIASAAGPPAVANPGLYVPPVFEDFEGPGVVELSPAATVAGLPRLVKLETMVDPGDLGGGGLVVRELGVRADGEAGIGPASLRGSVTLSLTRRAGLDRWFAANGGEHPITFFVEGQRSNGRGRSPIYVFRLPGGFRFAPAAGERLHVHLELESDGPLRLDAAPSAEPRLLQAADVLAEAGELSRQSLILRLGGERIRSAASPAPVVVERPGPPVGPGPERPGRAAPVPATPGPGLRESELERRLARLEARLADVLEAGERRAASLERQLSDLTAAVGRRDLERALETGRPTPGLLVPATSGSGLDRARSTVRAALRDARVAGMDVRGIERLADQADRELGRGSPGLAFLGYSRAYRSLLAQWWPDDPDLRPRPAEPLLAAGGPPLKRPAPYDFAGDRTGR